MSDLPLGWEKVAIVDLLAPLADGRIIHQGWSPQCAQGSSPNSDVWGVLKTTSIQNGRFLPEHNKLLPDTLEPRILLEVNEGDILLTCAGPRIRCGVPCLVRSTRPKLIISGKMYRMRAMAPYIESRFIEAMLRAPVTQDAIDKIKTGMSESGMNLTHARFAKLEIPVPPTNEQKRIADKLDAVLTRVDACRDRLDRVPAILKRFRQSVLAAATSGALTEDWRAEHPDLSTWESGTLAALLDGKPRNGYSPRAVEFETPVKSLTLTATTTGRFLAQHFKYIDEEIPKSSHLWLQPGDILVQRANTIEYVGVSAVYDGPPSGFIYPDLMMKCCANNKVVPQYLHYLLLSEAVRRHFRENATGTAGNMPKINQQTVLSAPAVWPSLPEQTEIVRRIESLFAFADRLEARYTAAHAQVEKLTPSLLAKAFRGELVPQDPNDEPASALLDRIASKRIATEVQPRRRQSTAGRKPTRAPKENAAVTKSRQDEDVQGKPYLAQHLRLLGGSASAEALFRVSELPVADFYKQLAWEVAQGHLRDGKTVLELADAA